MSFSAHAQPSNVAVTMSAARKQTRSILLASIAARIASAVDHSEESSDSETSDSDSECSSTESMTSISTFTTAASARASLCKAPQLTHSIKSTNARPAVFIDTSKTNVTSYLYAQGCSTVLTGGVMLGGPAVNVKPAQPAPGVWSRQPGAPWRTKAARAKTTTTGQAVGSWRRSVHV